MGFLFAGLLVVAYVLIRVFLDPLVGIPSPEEVGNFWIIMRDILLTVVAMLCAVAINASVR